MKYPSYQINIPPEVRFDKKLLPNAKLLYGEIKALCDQQGYCWAGNDYLSNLYGVKAKVVSRWINKLCKKGYLYVEISRGNQRKIFISSGLPKKEVSPPCLVEGGNLKVEGGLSKSRADEGVHLINNFIDYNYRINSVPAKDLSTKKWRGKNEKNVDKNSLPPGKYNGRVFPSPRVAPSPVRRSPPPKRSEAIRKFMKPSLKEVEAYMKISGHCQDSPTAQGQALRFVNHYNANGWKVGRNPMQDWQAAANNWLLNAKEYATHTKNLSRNDVSSPNSEPYASRLHSGRFHGGGTKDYGIPL